MSHHNHPHHHSSRHYGQPRPGGSGSSAAPPISHTPHSGNPSSAHSRDSSRQTPRSMDTRPVWKAPECPDLTRYITLDSTTTVAEGGFSYIYRGTVKYSTGKVQASLSRSRSMLYAWFLLMCKNDNRLLLRSSERTGSPPTRCISTPSSA